ncbi:MAG: hypothetical protein FWD15_06140 [Alphaproteobacteria bacterium]|nr:hypothetical protein [Alphaproteobacteria bacterium]
MKNPAAALHLKTMKLKLNDMEFCPNVVQLRAFYDGMSVAVRQYIIACGQAPELQQDVKDVKAALAILNDEIAKVEAGQLHIAKTKTYIRALGNIATRAYGTVSK